MKHSKILKPNNFEILKPYCSQESIEYLKNSLDRLKKGTPPTISFPLYGMRDVRILDNMYQYLGKDWAPQWLMEYEHSRATKWNPQGGIPEWAKLEDNFLLYKTAPKPVAYADSDVIKAMSKDYRSLHCQVLGINQALDTLIRSKKIEKRAAGWSEFQLKKTDKTAQVRAIQMIRTGDWRHGAGYTFSRFNKLKNRIFMPMPFSSMILQARWFVPFITNVQASLRRELENSRFTPWADKCGFDLCFDIMETELNKANLADDEYIVYFSNDFEKMDTRTSTSQYEHFVLPMFHAAFGNNQMDEALLFTTTAPIYSPGGMIVGDHGTASGAEVTNGGEGCCNDYFQRRMIKLLLEQIGKYVRVVTRRLNGDDSIIIFFVKKALSAKKFEQILKAIVIKVCQETGFDIQEDKFEISTVFGKYCQNVLEYDPKSKKLFWCYPITLVLNSIVNPEHQYKASEWDKDYRDLDVIQKLENARNHPAFHRLIDYVRSGMKYPLLGKSEEETRRILSKYDKYRALQSLGERYNREDFTPSKSLAVQYILTHR